MAFIARFHTGCALCDDPIEEGQVARMTYDGAIHDRCPRPVLEERPACPRCFLVHALNQEECE